MSVFKLKTKWEPRGDQPMAIEKITKSLEEKNRYQTLLGVTGGGKTFVMANVIKNMQIPTLVISHNKTLAAQLYSEFKSFFPENAVEYFVSYYDYYQPEAYIPQRDIYIEKDASINEQLDRLRLAATSSLLSRPDTIIIASVSCIYGLGDPDDYRAMMLPLEVNMEIERDEFLRKLVQMQYERNDIEFSRGHFRVRGDVIELYPSYDLVALRIEMFGDTIESISQIDPLTRQVLQKLSSVFIYPGKHFVTPPEKMAKVIDNIEAELEQHLVRLREENKLLEASRLESRTLYDIEMLREVGYCSGVENYSRHFSEREPGSRPHCLLDYFPRPFLTLIDESHVTIPQIRGMYFGDRSRKENLVNHGFRLPSALDNRPLQFPEWEELTEATVFVSATPAPYELEKSSLVVEQLIRPTGLLDPKVEVRPTENQVTDLIEVIRERKAVNERVLVTTLTKNLSEKLTEFLQEEGLKVAYLHCDIDAFERVDILQNLRRGIYDVVVGINLLREGLDLPEVSLVAILDADQQGFLRSETSLIQTMGRAARNINAMVILYADRITPAMEKATNETDRRRRIQMAHNEKHGIEPQGIEKEILASIEEVLDKQDEILEMVSSFGKGSDQAEQIAQVEEEMMSAAAELNFELAAKLRDRLLELKEGNKKGAKTKSSRQGKKRKKRI